MPVPYFLHAFKRCGGAQWVIGKSILIKSSSNSCVSSTSTVGKSLAERVTTEFTVHALSNIRTV